MRNNYKLCKESIDELLPVKLNDDIKEFIINLDKNKPKKLTEDELRFLKGYKEFYTDVGEYLNDILHTYGDISNFPMSKNQQHLLI